MRPGSRHSSCDSSAFEPCSSQNFFARLEEWEARDPARVVMHSADAALTMGQLLDRIRAGAIALREQGIGAGDRIVLQGFADADFVTASLSILLAGGCVVPAAGAAGLDAVTNRGTRLRARAVLNISAPDGAVAVTLRRAIRDGGLATPESRRRARAIMDEAVARPCGSEAFVMQTSGTTSARRNEVVSGWGGLTFYLDGFAAELGGLEGGRFSMLSAVTHDPIQREIFTPLYCGGTLVIPPWTDSPLPGALVDWLSAEHIEIMHLNPARIAGISAAATEPIKSLRTVITLGGAVSRSHVEQLRGVTSDLHLVCLYGATETQRAAGTYHLPAGRPLADIPLQLPIGFGCGDAELLVVDESGTPVPPGRPGVVAVVSDHVARGYCDPETGEVAQFPPLPNSRRRAFVTGDRAQADESGAVFVTGRVGGAQKVNGQRVNLREVELHARAVTTVRDAAAVVLSDAGQDYLGLFVVCEAEAAAAEIRAAMVSQAPAECVPNFVHVTAELPLTVNQKIDEESLREMMRRRIASILPKSDGEIPSAEQFAVWLGGSPSDVNLEISELGSSSVLFVSAVSRLRGSIDGHVLDTLLRSAWRAMTPASLHELLMQQGQPELAPGVPVPVSDGEVTELGVGDFAAIDVESEVACFRDGRQLVQLCSNSFLGLSGMIPSFGGRSMTSHGTLAFNGRSADHEDLEAALGQLSTGREVVLFGSGYAANVDAVYALADRVDAIVCEATAHHSVRRSLARSRVQVSVVQRGDMAALHAAVRQHASVGHRVGIVADGVSSVTADVLRLPEVLAVRDEFGAILLVDEANSFGVIGPSCRGVEEYHHRIGTVDIRTVTLGKSFAASGGAVMCSIGVADSLRRDSSSRYSTPVSPAIAGHAARAVRSVIAEGSEYSRRLRVIAGEWRGLLDGLGFHVRGDASVPICPVVGFGHSGREVPLFDSAMAAGLLVLPMEGPRAAKRSGWVRSTVTIKHDKQLMEAAAQRWATACDEAIDGRQPAPLDRASWRASGPSDAV